MADKQNKQNLRPDKSEVLIESRMVITEGREHDLGRKSAPPQARTGDNVPKQWQPPKNQSTPSNRTKKQ